MFISSLLFHFSIKFLNFEFKLWFESINVMLIFNKFIPKLLTLFLQILCLFFESIKLNWVLFPTKIQPDFVCKVIIKILRNIKFFLNNLQLILQRLIRVFHLNVLFLIWAIAVPTSHRVCSPYTFRAGFISRKGIAQNWAKTKIKSTIIEGSVPLSWSL